MLGLFSFSQSEDITPLSFGICCCKWKIHCQSISPLLLRCLFASSFLWFILPLMYSIFIIIYLRIGLFIYSLYYYTYFLEVTNCPLPIWETSKLFIQLQFLLYFSVFFNFKFNPLYECWGFSVYYPMVLKNSFHFLVCMLATSSYYLQFTIFLQAEDLQRHSSEKYFLTSEIYFITWFLIFFHITGTLFFHNFMLPLNIIWYIIYMFEIIYYCFEKYLLEWLIKLF